MEYFFSSDLLNSGNGAALDVGNASSGCEGGGRRLTGLGSDYQVIQSGRLLQNIIDFSFIRSGMKIKRGDLYIYGIYPDTRKFADI